MLYLWVEEYLRSQKSFISDVNAEGFLGNSIDALIVLDGLGRVCVVLGKLFGDIRADVTIPNKHNTVMEHFKIINSINHTLISRVGASPIITGLLAHISYLYPKLRIAFNVYELSSVDT